MQSASSCKPSLWMPVMERERIRVLYEGLNSQPPFLGRVRALFLPARELAIEIAGNPLIAIESAGRAVINLACAPFISGCSVKNSIFYTEKAISHVIDIPLSILPISVQYIHQVCSTFFNPKTVLSVREIPELKTDSFAREFFINLQDKIYSESKKPFHPWMTRIISPFIACSDVFLDTLFPLVETLEKIVCALMQTIGTLFLQPGCSLKGALYFTKEALQGISKTSAGLLMSPIKLVYQTGAIFYDPENAVSIQEFGDPLKKNSKNLPSKEQVCLDRFRHLYPDFSYGFNSSVRVEKKGELYMTLNEFKKKTTEMQKTIIDKLELQVKIEALGGEDFFDRLQKAEENVLELLTLFDLKKDLLKKEGDGWRVDPDDYAIKFAFLSQSEFSKLTLSEIQNASLDQILFLAKRLKIHTRTPDARNEEIEYAHALQIPLVKLSTLSSKQLIKVINQIPRTALHFLQNSQLETIDVSLIQEDLLVEILTHVIIDKAKFIRKIHVNQLKKIVGKLDGEISRLISIDQLKSLDLSQLSPDRLGDMFSYCNTEEKKEKQEQAERFASISVGNLRKVLKELKEETLKLVSQDQLKSLDLSDLSQDQLKDMFSYCSIEEKQEQAERFASISVGNLRKVLKELKGETLKLVSQDQLKSLDLSDLSQDQLKDMFSYCSIEEKQEQAERFASISVTELQKVLKKLEGKTLKLVFQDQLKSLDLSELLSDRLRDMFSYCSIEEKQEQAERFASIPVTKLQRIVEKLDYKVCRLISKDQLEGLELSTLKSNCLDNLFFYLDSTKKEEAERFACISIGKLKTILGKLSKETLKLVSQDQLKSLDLSQLPEDHLKIMFFYVLPADKEEQANRFACIPVEVLKKILTKLGGKTLKLISQDQLKDLDLSQLLSKRLNGMFAYCSIEKKAEQAARFASISVKELQKIVAKLQVETLQLISHDQLKGLQLSRLSPVFLTGMFKYDSVEEKPEQANRFANIPVEEFKKIVGKLEGKVLWLVSHDQLKELHLSQLLPELLTEMFTYRNKEEMKEQRERFANIPVEEFKKIQKKLDNQIIKDLASAEQFQSLDQPSAS